MFSPRSGCTSIPAKRKRPSSLEIPTRAPSISRLAILPCSLTTLVRSCPYLFPRRGLANICHAGHYIENTSATQNLTFIEIYKSERVADISLTQWLALTPAEIVSSVLKIPVEIVQTLKKEKQVFVHGNSTS